MILSLKTHKPEMEFKGLKLLCLKKKFLEWGHNFIYFLIFYALPYFHTETSWYNDGFWLQKVRMLYMAFIFIYIICLTTMAFFILLSWLLLLCSRFSSCSTGPFSWLIRASAFYTVGQEVMVLFQHGMCY